jgi:hypothetical protein
MTQYLVTNNLSQAQTQSQNYWNKILGRPKKAEDTTALMSACVENPIDHKGVIIIQDAEYNLVYPLLTVQEKTFADANLKPANDPYIVTFLAALNPPV